MFLEKTYKTYARDGAIEGNGAVYRNNSFRCFEAVVEEIMSEGFVRASCSSFRVGVFYSAIESETDYRTGDKTNYGFHLRATSIDNQRAVFNEIAKRQKEGDNPDRKKPRKYIGGGYDHT